MATQTLKQIDLTEQIKAVRTALNIGLESFGEIERVIDRHAALSGLDGTKPGRELRPTHPTGTANTVGMFASAYRALENMEAESL